MAKKKSEKPTLEKPSGIDFVDINYMLFNEPKTGTKTFHLTETVLRDLFRTGPKYFVHPLKVENYTKVYFKVDKAYHPTLDDFITLFHSVMAKGEDFEEEENSYSGRIPLYDFASMVVENGPRLFDYSCDAPCEDPFFDNEDNAVAQLYYMLSKEGEDIDSLNNLLAFALDCKENAGKPFKERKYSIFTMKEIIYFVGDSFSYNFQGEERDFFESCCLAVGEKGNARALSTLGFAYYEGGLGFPMDQPKATPFLERSFEIEQEPMVANTLGYIYYHGQDGSGKINPEKAFQYFSLGHAMGVNESTYKLADCYYYGYGCIQSYGASLSLLRNLEPKEFKRFLSTYPNKYADVVYRLGRANEEGKGVPKNLGLAEVHYLFARCAIAERSRQVDYLGDDKVALHIYDRSRAVTETLSEDNPLYRRRKIVNRYYSIYKTSAKVMFCKFKAEYNKSKRILTVTVSSATKGEHLLLLDADLNYCALRNEVEFSFTISPFSVSNIDDLLAYRCRKHASVSLDDELLTFADEEDNPVVQFEVEKAFMDSPDSKTLERAYTLVKAEDCDSGEAFLALSLDQDVDKGDIVELEEGKKKARVVYADLLYYDQLPFYEAKLPTCRKLGKRYGQA